MESTSILFDTYQYINNSLLGKLILFSIIIGFSYYVGELIALFVQSKLVKGKENKILAKVIMRIVQIVIILVGFALGLRAVGVEQFARTLLASAGLSALIIGFAFKDIGSNLLAGITLGFSRPFKAGDVIESGDWLGSVEDLGMRSTQIRTPDGKDIYIPNADIISRSLINYTGDNLFRQDFVIGIDYADNISEARECIHETLSKMKDVLKNPEPFVTVDEFTASTVNLRVYFWVNTIHYPQNALLIRSDVMSSVKESLIKQGYYLPSQVVELKMADDAGPFLVKSSKK